MQTFFVAVAVIAVAGCSDDAPSSHRMFSSQNDPVAGSGGMTGMGAFAADNSKPVATVTGSAGTNAGPTRPPGTGDDPGKCGAVTQMAQNMLQPVDIIFGVDTTGSMAEEIAFTEENMNAFSQQITDAGIDVRVILISGPKDGMQAVPVYVEGVCIAAPLGSGSCPEDARAPSYVHIPQPLADWDILQNYIDLYPMYRQYLRESSFKTFVSISDGDIAANPVTQQPINSADAFIAAVKALEPNSPMWATWRYSAIYSFSACGVGNDVGVTHADLVKRTQGVGGDLCLQDFEPVFNDLAKQVTEVVTLACDWAVPPPPQGETFDPGKTNVQLTLDGSIEQLGKAATAADCGARDGWHYDDDAAPRQVVACPSTCTRIQAAVDAKVDVLFGCETVVLPPPD